MVTPKPPKYQRIKISLKSTLFCSLSFNFSSFFVFHRVASASDVITLLAYFSNLKPFSQTTNECENTEWTKDDRRSTGNFYEYIFSLSFIKPTDRRQYAAVYVNELNLASCVLGIPWKMAETVSHHLILPFTVFFVCLWLIRSENKNNKQIHSSSICRIYIGTTKKEPTRKTK